MADNNDFEFDKLSESNGGGAFKEGDYQLTILDVNSLYAKTGAYMYQFTWQIEGTKLKLNYDNCVLKLADGSDCTMGQHKLKNIIRATGVTVNKFNVNTLRPLLVGKTVTAHLKANEKGYPVLEDANSIKAVAQEQPTVNPIKTELEKLSIGEEDITDEFDI